MSENRHVSNIFYRQTVVRRMPMRIRIIILMLYFSVLVLTFLGAFSNFLMLIPTLGTLFLAWSLKGTASISYEYQLDGYDFKIRRLSGMRQKPVDVLFASLDLRRVIIIGDQDGDAIFEAEAMFQAAPKHRRVTYYTSAQNPDKPSIVLYAHGYGPEEGYIVRVYLQPSNQLLSCLRKLCPGKVHSSVDAI